jgi:hypothetical protein
VLFNGTCLEDCEELDTGDRGLSAVPGEIQLGSGGGRQALDDVVFQQAFRHAEGAGIGVEAALVDVLAVLAGEIADGPGRLCEDLELACGSVQYSSGWLAIHRQIRFQIAVGRREAANRDRKHRRTAGFGTDFTFRQYFPPGYNVSLKQEVTPNPLSKGVRDILRGCTAWTTPTLFISTRNAAWCS